VARVPLKTVLDVQGRDPFEGLSPSPGYNEGHRMRTFFGLVGLAMFLGFGALFVSEWRELGAYPATPTPMTVHEAVLREDPGLGAWVELIDVHFPCDQQEQIVSGSRYRLGFGDTVDDRIIVSGRQECSDAPVRVTGVLATASPGRIVDLEFPGFDFEHWPRAWQSTLWTESGPEDSRFGVVLMPPFALIGLLILAFFWKPEPVRSAKLEKLEQEPLGPPWTEGEQVLPARPLQLAGSSLYDRVLAFSFLLVVGWMMGVLAWFSITSMGGAFGIFAGLFFGVLALGVIFVALKAAWTLRKNDPTAGSRVEALAQLEFERPMGVGNMTIGFTHPLTGAKVERVIGLHEARPLVVNGALFVVWSGDPQALMIIREDFTPFDLTPAEQRESLRKLRRWTASQWKANSA
jgi:hypothetical protein